MMVRLVLLALFTLLSYLGTHSSVQAGRLTCGVCEALVDEVNAGIVATAHTHSVQTRFRVDEKKRVPYARTEHNLLEIMEASDFPKKFEKYGLVKPHTKTASHMKRAYELAAEGKVIDPIPKPQPPPTQETATPPATEATPTPAATTDAAAGTDAAAATPADPSTPPADAATAPATPPSPPPVVPHVSYRPSGALPLSLRHNHFHLVASSTVINTGLTIDTSSSARSEIKSEVESFLEEYLDEAMLMFHRDVPDLKTKLCVEITEACTPQKRKPKNAKTATPAADDASSTPESSATKDDL